MDAIADTTGPQVDQLRAAVTRMERALHGTPSHDTPQVRLALAQGYNVLSEPAKALATLHPLVAGDRASGAVWLQVGMAFQALGDRPQALTALQHAVKLTPQLTEAWVRLGIVLTAESQPEAAARAFRSAAEHDPTSSLPLIKLGLLQMNRGRLAEAAEILAAASKRHPDDPTVAASRATVAERAGQLEDAGAMVAPLIRRSPPPPLAAFVWANVCRRQHRPEDALQVVEAAIGQPMPTVEASQLLHARADLLDAMGRTDDAFAAYTQANEHRGLRFDARRHLEAVRQLTAQFRTERWPTLPRSGLHDRTPVLIVGMPRSGTSLVEQILASHPQVTGAGELEDWRLLAIATSAHGGLPGIWYHHLDALTPSLLHMIGDNYLRRLHDLAEPGSVRVTDKMPNNVLHLPLAALACPGARVIHCVRDPMDVGWSIYRQRFHDGLSWATNLATIGGYQRATDLAMAHWKAVLPLPIHTVSYEALLANPEQETRALCEAAGVPFHEACLRFHDSPRHVATASYAQVRQPLYQTSRGRSARYAHHLGALRDALDDG